MRALAFTYMLCIYAITAAVAIAAQDPDGPSIPDNYADKGEPIQLTVFEQMALDSWEEVKVSAKKDGAVFLEPDDVYMALDNMHGDSTPFALGQGDESGRCVVFMHIRGSRSFDYSIHYAPRVLTQTKIRTMLAHESGHCVHAWRKDLSVPFKTHTHDAELFADYYALAWTARYHPDDFEGAMQFLMQMRRDRSASSTIYPVPLETERGERLRYIPASADMARECADLVKG
jgi:hypothetical protein